MQILVTFLVFMGVCAAALYVADRYFRAPGYDGSTSDHFDGKKFFSYGAAKNDPVDEGLKAKASEDERGTSVIKWMLSRPKNKWKWRDAIPHEPIKERVMADVVRLTYINHTTVLIQTGGINIVTDPIWANRASPVQFLGPKRYQGPGLGIDELPPIDLVLLSHNHYDHLDLRALRFISRQWNPQIYTPLGNAGYLLKKGITGVQDLDWWNSETIEYKGNKLTINCVPAQHFSARGFSDRNKTLWAGFMIHTPSGPIYFAGDTGYGSFVSKIAERYTSIRLALLPIGAYKPEWFMSEVHISPDQAVQIHTELKVKTSLATHFGTFYLADDRQDEPVERLVQVMKEHEKRGEEIDFRALKNGESFEV